MDELGEITARAAEAEETLRAIRGGEVDALVITTVEGCQVFTLVGADHPYRVMVETMNEGAATLASDGTILFCNQRFADIVKVPLENVFGSSIFQYFSSGDHEFFKGLLEQGLKGGRKEELALQNGSEHPLPVLASMSPLQHPDTPGAVCLVVADLTDLKRGEERLRASERGLRSLADQLIHVQENERKRIARDMHDSLGASLSALKFKLEDLINNLPDLNQWQVGESLDSLILIIQETIGEARRMQNDLRPPHLDDLGLLPTLSWLSGESKKVFPRITVEQRLAVLEQEIPERLKVVIFRIVQEAMNNIGKHARATQAWISLSREQNGLQLVIGDNGAGFDWKGPLESTGRSSGMGLSIMKERADLSGGSLSIVSHPGEGTMVKVCWTLDSVTGVADRTD